MASWQDEELGRALRGLDLAWPEPAEDLSVRVRAEVEGRPWRPAARSRAGKTLLLAAAIVLLLAAAAVGARLVFDLGAISIEPLPTGRPLPTDSEFPELGRRVSVTEAEALTGTTALVPTALGEPDRAWVDEPEDRPIGAAPTRIVMAWEATEELPAIPGSPYGAVLIRWDAHVAAGVKLVGRTFEGVEVPGWAEAYWVRDPHELVLFTDDGPVRVLVRGHVLLWGDGFTTFRLETALPQQQAVAIAATTPGTGSAPAV
jgi:hypothetical protein